MKIVDPFGTLSEHTKEVARRMALRTDAAEHIRFTIADHLADLEANDELEEPFTRGYRMGLRVAYLAAGGEVDGSEEGWAAVIAAVRP